MFEVKNAPNELKPEFLGVTAFNPFAKHNSSSRAVMHSSHLAQKLVIEGLTEKRTQSGLEKSFAPYTFNVKQPANGRIIKVIDRYPKGNDANALMFNPETIVIYENEDTKEIDYYSIPYYCSHHQTFGFKYDIKPEVSMLKPGAYVAKDTIFADSPGVSENGGYMYGIGLNMAFMSLPSVSEDGIMISRDVLDRLKFRLYETRVVEFGAHNFPLNLHGSKDHYKPFKDIGEELTDDGLLMMLRDYDDDLSPIDVSIFDTMEPDWTFDKGVYVRSGKGRVVDIKVIGSNTKNRQLPEGMSHQVVKYQRALLKFYKEIIDTEERLRYERKRKFNVNSLNLSPRFHRLVMEAMAILDVSNHKFKQPLNLLYRKAPIDEYRVEFIVEYVVTPNIGFKLTDSHGGKGVICKIEEPENMPVDTSGNRADVVMDAASTISRMNLGRLYEHYLNSASRDVSKYVKQLLKVTTEVDPTFIAGIERTLVDQAYEYLLGYYKIVSEVQYNFYLGLSSFDRIEHIANVCNNGLYLYMPIENDRDMVHMVKMLEQHYKPTYGPVSYVGNSGQRCVTDRPVRISELYMMLLEKIADDWSSVSSGKLQHFGILSPMTKSEKFSYPFRNTPIRTIGETEGRIFAGYCGREAITEMMDRSNSPAAQRNAIWNILQADKPTNIEKVVDREHIRLGNNKPLSLVSHILNCAGVKFTYEEENI